VRSMSPRNRSLDNVASAITGGSRPEHVKDNAAAAGKSLSSETLAGIDEVLADFVERDGSLVAMPFSYAAAISMVAGPW